MIERRLLLIVMRAVIAWMAASLHLQYEALPDSVQKKPNVGGTWLAAGTKLLGAANALDDELSRK